MMMSAPVNWSPAVAGWGASWYLRDWDLGRGCFGGPELPIDSGGDGFAGRGRWGSAVVVRAFALVLGRLVVLLDDFVVGVRGFLDYHPHVAAKERFEAVAGQGADYAEATVVGLVSVRVAAHLFVDGVAPHGTASAADVAAGRVVDAGEGLTVPAVAGGTVCLEFPSFMAGISVLVITAPSITVLRGAISCLVDCSGLGTLLGSGWSGFSLLDKL